jgi:hypothetical protein
VPEHVHMLAPGAHHTQAFHVLGTVLGRELISLLLSGVCDEAAHFSYTDGRPYTPLGVHSAPVKAGHSLAIQDAAPALCEQGLP